MPAPLARLAVGGLMTVVALTGCSSSSATPSASSSPSSSRTPLDAGLGAMPSFLPSASTNTVGHGSVSKPALSYPGVPVIVSTGKGQVTIALVGPSYPSSTKVDAEQVDCVFTVTFSQATATIDLAKSHFDVYDSNGRTHKLPAVGGLPASIHPGQSLSVKLRATLPSGEGLVRWFPSGTMAASAWDYVAETD